MNGYHFINEILPWAALCIFVFTAVFSLIKRTWSYFYVGLILMAIYFYFSAIVTIFPESIGIQRRKETYSDLPFKNFWEFLAASFFIFGIYGAIGFFVSIIRKFIGLKTKLLFYISVSLILIGIVTLLLEAALPCNLAPMRSCTVNLQIPVQNMPV